MSPESACFRKLRKSFLCIKNYINSWNETVNHSREKLESLSNLVVQLQACNKTSFNTEPLNEFADLKQKLNYKLVSSLEYVIATLRKDMSLLEGITHSLGQQKESCFEVYNGHSEALGIDMAVHSTPTRPSIAEFLEWLVDIEQFYRRQYNEKEELFDNVRYDDLATVQALQISYKKQGNSFRVRAIMEKVEFFLSASSDE